MKTLDRRQRPCKVRKEVSEDQKSEATALFVKIRLYMFVSPLPVTSFATPPNPTITPKCFTSHTTISLVPLTLNASPQRQFVHGNVLERNSLKNTIQCQKGEGQGSNRQINTSSGRMHTKDVCREEEAEEEGWK